MFSPNAKTRPPSRENGLSPDLRCGNLGAREPARHPRIDRNPHGGVAPLHCPAGQTVVMTVEYRDGIGVTPLLTKGSHVEIRGVGTCPATWNESATLPASCGNPAQVSMAGGVLLSPLPTKSPQDHRRPSSLDPGLISQVTRSITGACVQLSPSGNRGVPRRGGETLPPLVSTRRNRRFESSALEALRSRCESCRRDHSQQPQSWPAEQPRPGFHRPGDPQQHRSLQPIKTTH